MPNPLTTTGHSPTPRPRRIDVVGAGILGLWQALTLARAGHRVRLIDRANPEAPFNNGQSRYAGAMLAPYCEAEAAPPIVRERGLEALKLWRDTYPHLSEQGTLVLASPRDRPDLVRFSRLAPGHEPIQSPHIAKLEPDLEGRFADALYYADEAHMTTPDAMSFLLDAIRAAGARIELATTWQAATGDASHDTLIIDCRGLVAKSELPALRGVRGERLLVRTRDVALHRPVRLLHPRHPLYVVPWRDGLHVIGATVLESDDDGPATVRSALELLGTAFALHPAFGEAEILDIGAGVRPAFPDNVPRAIVRGRYIHVNGAYRHGFLLAPALAATVCAYLENGATDDPFLVVD